MNLLQNAIFLVSLAAVTYIAYRYSNIKVAIILAVFGGTIFIIKQLPIKVDRFLHKKLIKIPRWMKCIVDINCPTKGCSRSLAKQFESQYNADIDVFTIGHFVMWMLITIFETRLRLWHVLLASVVWEATEVIGGCLGFPLHGRITDVVFNSLGFLAGAFIRGIY